MKTLARYNIDNTLDIYPVFSQKRWEKYRKIKRRLGHLERHKKELEQHIPSMLERTVPTIYDDRKMRQANLELSRLEKEQTVKESYGYFMDKIEQCKIALETIHPAYNRKNSKVDGFTLNRKAQKKVRNIMYMLFESMKMKKQFKTEFYTFTVTSPHFEYVPEKHDSVVSKQFLKLIKNLKKNWGLKSYVYVAERQTGKRKEFNVDNPATNRIHFHCIFIWEDTPPRVLQVNYYWLQLLEQIGFKTFSEDRMREFIEKHENSASFHYVADRHYTAMETNKITDCLPYRGMNYNYGKVRDIENDVRLVDNPYNRIIYHPVDVEPIKDLKQLAIYLNKYVVKSEDKIFSRVWGATKSYLKATTSIVFTQIDNIIRLALENVQVTKKGLQMIYEKTFKVGLGRMQREFKYTKIFLTDSVRERCYLYNLRKSLIQNFIL